MPDPSLHRHYSRFITTTIRSAAIVSPRPRCPLPPDLSGFDKTTMTSLVPICRLTCVPANLTPGATQPIIRHSLCFVSDANVTTRFSLRLALSRLHHWFTCVQLHWSQLRKFLSRFSSSLTTTSFPRQQHEVFWKLPRKGVSGRPPVSLFRLPSAHQHAPLTVSCR